MRCLKLKACLILSLTIVTACSIDKDGRVSLETASQGMEAHDSHGVRPPLETVNQRMEAYNNHDIDRFISTYADDVEIYIYPDIELAQGTNHLKSIFEPMFEAKIVSVEIHHQIAKDGYVINHETVSYNGDETEYVSIYEVRKGIITSVRFVRD